jgi:MoaA/NifB/PqqE/SkfB family radical SAM enzyme
MTYPHRNDRYSLPEIASALKIAGHTKRLDAFLRGESIFPVTLELDITTHCTRKCAKCPMIRSSFQRHLDLEFVENLFSRLEGQTGGLLVAGGEPTLSPVFPEILAAARKHGFQEVAIVTNGSLLHNHQVVDALISHSTVVRISMYTWGEDKCGGVGLTLRQVESLRTKVEKHGSRLDIGVSVLTWKDRAKDIANICDAVRSAGAHWVYFHPMCDGWEKGAPASVGQEGVLKAIRRYRQASQDGFKVFVSRLRYEATKLQFSGYHAAHFLCVVGADGKNYLGAEVKYQPQYIIANLSEKWRRDFLWHPDRQKRIERVGSNTYSALSSRHRGALYSDLIERLKQSKDPLQSGSLPLPKNGFGYPYVL